MAYQNMAADLIKGLHEFLLAAQQAQYDAYDLETRLDLLEVYWKGFTERAFILQ